MSAITSTDIATSTGGLLSWQGGTLLPSAPPGLGVGLGLLAGLGCSLAWGWLIWSAAKRWGRAATPDHLREEPVLDHGQILALCLVAGPLLAGWFMLLLNWVESPLTIASPYLLGAGALCLVFIARRQRFAYRRFEEDPFSIGLPQRFFHAVPLLTLGMLAVALLIAATLPTTDYDGIVIWSYRTRVFVQEGTFYTGSFLDSLRLIPMMSHPYLLPVVEALWCVGGGAGFSWIGQRAPHFAITLGWVVLAWGAWRYLRYPAPWAWAVAAPLAALPCATLGPWMESAREPIIGILMGAATLLLVLWMHCPGWPAGLILGTCLAVLAQQIKVEGSPGLMGFAVAAVWIWFLEPWRSETRRLRWSALWRSGLLAAVIVFPWALMKTTLPQGDFGYNLTQGLSTDILQRHEAILAVALLTVQEFTFRPEYYGVAAPLALWCCVMSLWKRGIRWKWRAWLAAPAPFIAPLAIYLAVALVYVVRQEVLPAERNVTFSRRVFALMPAMIVAILALPGLIGKPHADPPLADAASGTPCKSQ